ncbi:MAG: transcriptional repressor [Lachnospiraceae bacterium]|nr:transcriptional repressor [Lachnospiraceae bacterium]
MTTRSKYKTKQREFLIDFFKSKPGEHITAGDVCEYFKEQGCSIGQSTIYRHLESLVDDGIINKYIIDCNSPACFEYMGESSHEECECCFHCKCEKCGKLIHLHCEELEEIREHLNKEHKFKLNPMRTVFYGVCEECADKE